ncbi:hypothetical protein FA13DRAFT_1091693 [Coprinellus micaceus]|uniref:Uncharacterized protein n=1 Tax=Coprinellus micaceus TaxID=71717 RepID=A0A4Y7TTN8_COPMI|nr:hypothetical protein FA13DRAFT_1091693 [Coprinellus micaceus]
MALVYGCKAYGGRLLRVIGRDGAVYYLAAAVTRVVQATLQIPGVTESKLGLDFC